MALKPSCKGVKAQKASQPSHILKAVNCLPFVKKLNELSVLSLISACKEERKCCLSKNKQQLSTNRKNLFRLLSLQDKRNLIWLL